MNKHVRLFFVSILLLTATAIVYTQENELTIIAGESFIPYSFYSDEGTATGIDIDYLNTIAEKLSIKVNFILTPWETAFDKLLSGEGDVVLSVTPSEERAAYLDFSISYMSLEMYVFFNKNIENIFKKSDLDNIPIGMPKGTPYEIFFKDIAVTPIFYEGYQNVYKAVANNEISTALSPDVTGSYFLAKFGVSNMFKRMNNPILTEEITMAVRKGDKETLDLINKGIRLINKNEYENIIQSFIGVELNLIEIIDIKLLIFIILGIILIISVIIVWNILLRKSVTVMTSELRTEKENLHVTIDSIRDAVISTDISGMIIMMNPSAEKLIGCSLVQSRGQNIDAVFKVFDSKTKKQLVNPVKQVIKSADRGGIETYSTLISLYGDEFQIANSASPIRNEEGITTGVVLVFRDITEQNKTLKFLIQSEKMLSVGGLAAGMAHEINNPLAGMMQSAEVMSIRLGGDMNLPANIKAAEEAGTTIEAISKFMEARRIPRMIDAISQSGKRVALIVENMLSFARKSDTQSSTHDLVKLMDQTLELAETEYDLRKHYDFKRIEIRKEYEADLPSVQCGASKIQQVFLNILHNGAEAMHHAGIVKPLFILRLQFDKSHKMIVIEIEDNGPGMTSDVRKRVFEPFFTTKPVGVGTGLGLSVAYFIITENHEGEMKVESRPGNGTMFIIRLPVEG